MAAIAPSVKMTGNYVVRAQLEGDSITFGVGGSDEPGYRGVLYYSAQAAGKPIYMTGTASNAGSNSGAPRYLGIDPYSEGISGATTDILATLLSRISAPGPNSQGTPDLIMLMIGTNNLDPAITSPADSPAVVAGKIGTLLTTIYGLRDSNKPWVQIALCEITPRLDAVDASVQATNALLPAMLAGLPANVQAVTTLISTYSSVPKVAANFSGGTGQHFTDAGYVLLGNGIYPQLAPVILKARG